MFTHNGEDAEPDSSKFLIQTYFVDFITTSISSKNLEELQGLLKSTIYDNFL